jgi:uncharacterized protein (DUF362 family)
LVRAAKYLLTSNSTTNVGLAGIAQGASEESLQMAIREATLAATDFSWLSRGDAVLIKPVVNSGNKYPATTHPISIKAMVSLLKEKGAGRVVVSDLSGIEHVKLTPDKLRGSTRDLMTSCGVAQAAQAAGAEIILPEEQGWDAFYEDEPIVGSNWKGGIMMPSIIKEVDHMVLLPRCGRHMLLGASLGMKAAVGYWRTDTRLEYHRDAATIQEKTAEANTVAGLREKQRLTLTLADKIMVTKGPDDGYIVKPKTGLVLASESLVAHDMASMAWLLYGRERVPEEERQSLKDPYTVQFMVNMANKVVTGMLGGAGQAFKAEKLLRNDIDSIWDDRVLKRAFQLNGGIPRLNFVEANTGIPERLKRKLESMTTPAEDKVKVLSV